MNFKVKWNGMGAVLGLSLLILSSAWASVPPLNKVVWIWLEGTPYLDGISGSYVRSLTRNLPSVRFSHFHSVSPTTQGNGIAMIAGTDLGVQDNDLTRIFAPTLVDILEAKGIPWKVYAEDFPGACYLSQGVGNYKRYRVPFLSVDKVQSDRYQCMKILNYSNLIDDLKNGFVPQFSVIIPNLKNSGALGDPTVSDQTLKTILSPFLKNEDLLSSTTFVISTTSNEADQSKDVFGMIFGKRVKDYGKVISEPVNHYHILRTLEEGMSLGTLNQEDSKVEPLTGFWSE